MEELAAKVKARAIALGFHRVGIASAEPFAEAEEQVLEWIREGYKGEMNWITEERACRSCRPGELLPGARSIISVAVSYVSRDEVHLRRDGRPTGRVARYAWGRDYHDALVSRLRRLAAALSEIAGRPVHSRVLVDTAPFLDREAAVRAGIGFRGKNTNLLVPGLGSFVFLGSIVSDLELPPDPPLKKDCGSCRLCIDACPTGAIVDPFKVDARRCIAYLTIENRGPIPPDLRPALGDWVFGCDICQEVCPWNRKARPIAWPEFSPSSGVGSRLDLLELVEMTEEQYREKFRGSPVKRAGWAGLRRNAAAVLMNLGR